MPNIHDCLQRAVDAGELDRTRAREAGSQFDQLVARFEQSMPRHQAEARAAADLKEATSAAAARRFHSVINQLQSMRRLRGLIEDAPDPATAIRNLIEYSEGSGFKGESVVSIQRAIITSINGEMAQVLKKHHQTLLGRTSNPAEFENLVREMHGETTGDAVAKELAEATDQAQDSLRRQFNAHGGDIGKLDNYGLAHTHDRTAIKTAKFDAWAEFLSPRLDWNRIVDRQTGKPFGEGDTARKTEFLQRQYDEITTKGQATKEPSMAMGGKALYNQRAEARVLHFKSGSDWLAYNKAFGSTDPFNAMIGGLHGLARDVAMMRVLGPNPRMGLEYAIQVAEKRVQLAGDEKAIDSVDKWAKRSRTMLEHVTGAVNAPESKAMASFFGGTRNILTAIQLGSAPLSAVTDIATIGMAAKVMGMKPTNVLSRSVQLMASSATRETAARMGYVADTLADMGSTAARFTGEQFMPEYSRRVSGFTMRVSLLSALTDMNRTAWRMEFAGHLADNAGRAFEQIDAPLRAVFENRGITAADWDALRAPDGLFTADNGATFLSPVYWRNAQKTLPPAEANGLSYRLQGIIEEQLEYAVPTANIEGKVLMQGATRPGTWVGEGARSTGMYKSFALSLTINQIRRVAAMPTPLQRISYAVKMSAALLVLGALSVQLREVAKGRDPRPMFGEGAAKFWLGALFQSGGLGIFGDFFSSETSRAGGGLAETVAGPVVGLAGDIIRPVSSNIQRVAEGKDMLLGRDIANFVRYNTPVASSLWPTRLAFDRLVADQLQMILDPEAEALFRRQEKARKRNYGTTSWWERGKAAPERAPDLSNALGDAR